GTAVGVGDRYTVGAGGQTTEVFGGLAVAPQVGVGLGATCYYQVNRAVGLGVTCCVGYCASGDVDLQCFRLFDGETGIVGTAVGVGYRYTVGAGGQTTEVFGGLSVAPQ